ncbi:serine hydrolase domain-containing protein [Glycomyces harbinensis]|uniref:CubicO group peptidase, beta-lactamase class C family n=1 Tax=Glycomyces harbinensis TaxID=58114 RepID=A0A1G6UW60_9ACTN|nr:serine hydrolase domain-containing protein [Glycomyces harbinensis]SDD45568.1 CubicO group peptidase, beta-lactamase class C family [Glycomyces harbinensis]
MNKPAPLLVPALVLGAVFAAVPAHAQDETDVAAVADLIDTRIAAILDEHEIPGGAAVLVVDGEPVLTEAYGEAVVGGAPFATDTAYYTGSVAKLFTTAASLQLVDEGALDLDADVNDYLDFDVPDTFPGDPVTLRHLLTHTSGFEDRILGWGRWAPEDMPSLADFAAQEQPERLREPGTLIAYNNYDMVLAGVLIEEASGQSYEDVLSERLFTPLGMDDTRVVREEPAKGADAAEGYRYADGQVVTAGRIAPGTAAGPGVLSTADDLSRFMAALAQRDPILGEGVAEQMTTRQFGSDDRMPGIGFSLQEFAGPGDGVWFKAGDLPGFHTALAVVPDRGISVHVAFNGAGESAAATSFAAEELVRDVLAALGALPEPQAFEPVEDDLDRYTGEYVSIRTASSDFTELARVVAPVTVETADGGLTTTGLSSDPAAGEQRWVPVGDGLFQEQGGTATIAFTDYGILLSSVDPAVSFAPVPWYNGALLHQVGLGAGGLILAAGFLALSATAVVRLVRRAPRRPVLRSLNAWSSWLTGAAALAVLGLLMSVVSDANLLLQQVVTGSPGLTATMWAALAAVGLAAVNLVLYAAAAAKRQWSMWPAVGQGLMVAGGAAFSVVLIALNLAVL